MTAYRAIRQFPKARSEEDAQMARWNSAPFATKAEAVEALVEHMVSEARSLMNLGGNISSHSLKEHALELAQLAGAIGTTAASTADLEQVTAANGVVYSVRKFS